MLKPRVRVGSRVAAAAVGRGRSLAITTRARATPASVESRERVRAARALRQPASAAAAARRARAPSTPTDADAVAVVAMTTPEVTSRAEAIAEAVPPAPDAPAARDATKAAESTAAPASEEKKKKKRKTTTTIDGGGTGDDEKVDEGPPKKPETPRVPKPDRRELDRDVQILQAAADEQQARIEALKRKIEAKRETKKSISQGAAGPRARIAELNAEFNARMVRARSLDRRPVASRPVVASNVPSVPSLVCLRMRRDFFDAASTFVRRPSLTRPSSPRSRPRS